jgi:hypothetical protein
VTLEGDLAALADKYRALVALRARREELEAQGRYFSPAEGVLRRGAFRLVARDFPGSLRELDRTPAAALRAKLQAVEEELARVRRGEPVARPWVLVVLDFHRTLREALAVKLWLAQRIGRDGEITSDVATEFQSWHGSWPHPHGALCGVDRATLAEHHHPPGGRVVSLVWRALGAAHGLAEADLRELVFGRNH